MESRKENRLALQDGTNNIVQTDNPRVCAIILTFNWQVVLECCLASIGAQTRRPDSVLVVDNHSSDGTSGYLESLARTDPSLAVLRTSANLGPAGGYAAGITWAVQKGYDYLWLMDDDCTPEPFCLETQLREMGEAQDQIVFPQNLDELDRIYNRPAWRGVLIPRQVVHRAGIPNEDLFFSKEDTEYLQWRIQKIYHVKAKLASQAIVRYRRFESRHKPAWKFYYQARNSVYYRLSVQRYPRFRRCRKLLVSITRLWLRILLIEDRRLRKSRYLMLGIWHGLRGRLGKTIDPASR